MLPSANITSDGCPQCGGAGSQCIGQFAPVSQYALDRSSPRSLMTAELSLVFLESMHH